MTPLTVLLGDLLRGSTRARWGWGQGRLDLWLLLAALLEPLGIAWPAARLARVRVASRSHPRVRAD